jgi:hypothetical protein
MNRNSVVGVSMEANSMLNVLLAVAVLYDPYTAEPARWSMAGWNALPTTRRTNSHPPFSNVVLQKGAGMGAGVVDEVDGPTYAIEQGTNHEFESHQ